MVVTKNNVICLILEMADPKAEPPNKITLNGVCNPRSKLYDVKYLHYDADNILISFENWRGAYPQNTDKEVLQILIKGYYENK